MNDKKVTAPETATGVQAATFGRDVLLLVASLPALVAVLGRGDVQEIVNWFASQPGLAFCGAVLAIGTLIWRQLLARRHVRQMQKLEAAPAVTNKGSKA